MLAHAFHGLDYCKHQLYNQNFAKLLARSIKSCYSEYELYKEILEIVPKPKKPLPNQIDQIWDNTAFDNCFGMC